MTELKPCPFCGNKTRVRLTQLAGGWLRATEWGCECLDCNATLGRHPDEQQAIAAWNRREARHD